MHALVKLINCFEKPTVCVQPTVYCTVYEYSTVRTVQYTVRRTIA